MQTSERTRKMRIWKTEKIVQKSKNKILNNKISNQCSSSGGVGQLLVAPVEFDQGRMRGFEHLLVRHADQLSGLQTQEHLFGPLVLNHVDLGLLIRQRVFDQLGQTGAGPLNVRGGGQITVGKEKSIFWKLKNCKN